MLPSLGIQGPYVPWTVLTFGKPYLNLCLFDRQKKVSSNTSGTELGFLFFLISSMTCLLYFMPVFICWIFMLISYCCIFKSIFY